MRQWWMVVVCSGAMACPSCGGAGAMAPEQNEQPPAEANPPIDMVQYAKQLQEAVDRGEITPEEMDDRLLKAAMGEIKQIAPVVPRSRFPEREPFDVAKQQQQFDEWIDTIVSDPEADGGAMFRFVMLYEQQQLTARWEEVNTGPSLGIMLAHTIETDPRLRRHRRGRAIAITALCNTGLQEEDLRDATVRELLLRQLRNGGENADFIVGNILFNVPKEHRGLWYAPFAEQLRSADPKTVIRSCGAMQTLGIVAPDDREYLMSLITDLRGTSEELFKQTYLTPYDRMGLAYQLWPRSRVRAEATATVLHTTTEPKAVLASFEAVQGPARFDVASGIASMLCGYKGFDVKVWDEEALDEAFALLDRILADPGAKVVVVDPQADLWSEFEFRPYGNSILSDLCSTTDGFGNPAVTPRALSSALRAARAHGDPELAWSVYFFVRNHDHTILDKVPRGTTTIDIGAEMVELAKELRAAVDRGELTEQQMQRILEQEADRRIMVP
ncbi:MAG: hypothetical protein ACF8MJ_05485 [Phycisphaerales bacterium JB050]